MLESSGVVSRRDLAKPSLKQILGTLRKQVLVGKSYVNLANGLLQADPVILQTAPTFFGLTMDGSLELAQMTVARLYDKRKGTLTVERMLAQASQNIDSFQRGDQQQVRANIAKAEQVVLGLKPVVDAIRLRRNEWLAHIDPETVANSEALSAKAKLTIPDLERALKETEGILVELSSLYEGTTGDLYFIGGDDYKAALNSIRLAKCAAIEDYEKESGETYTGPRPKDCSRGKFDPL